MIWGCIPHGSAGDPVDGGQWEQPAAKAAADLYTKLQTGNYRTASGQVRPINGDFTKLSYAEGLTDQQRRLLADFKFRTKTFSGTREIFGSIGHVAYWSNVVYGPRLFATVTPGKRQNYLAASLLLPSKFEALCSFVATANYLAIRLSCGLSFLNL